MPWHKLPSSPEIMWTGAKESLLVNRRPVDSDSKKQRWWESGHHLFREGQIQTAIISTCMSAVLETFLPMPLLESPEREMSAPKEFQTSLAPGSRLTGVEEIKWTLSELSQGWPCVPAPSSPASFHSCDFYGSLGSCSALLWDTFSNEQVVQHLAFI